MTIVEDRLFFFSQSADLPPGQGVHEQVANAAGYAPLAGIRHWRKMLSNFWPADFVLGGRTYRTVEHAFQAAKIATVDPVLAEQFALESGTELACGDGVVARKNRKLVVLDEAQLRAWDERKHAVMRDAMRAKFSRHEALCAVLLATRPAELWHGAGRGQQPTRMHELETIRDEVGPKISDSGRVMLRDERVDPVEIVARVGGVAFRSTHAERGYEVWVHLARSAGWDVVELPDDRTVEDATDLGAVRVEGIKYRIRFSPRVRRLVVDARNGHVAYSDGLGYAAWAEPDLADYALE